MASPSTDSLAINRDSLLARYRGNRDRSRKLFDLLSEDAYYSQPIALRHPIVFYEGHLPAFSFNTLVKKALGGKAGSTLKKLIYDIFEQEVAQRPMRETIE